MIRREFLDVATQVEPYQRIIDGAGDLPVTFRAFDIGGGKNHQSFATEVEENLAMGWRSLRILLDRPSILRYQLRAMTRAGVGRALRLMPPMVMDVAEVDQAKCIVDHELARARDRGQELPSALQLGVMIEIPSLLWQMDELLCRVDLIVVDSNGLFQFILSPTAAVTG